MNEAPIKTQSAETLTLNINRVIRAKRQRVYEAWTNPKLLAKWFACGEGRHTTASADVKVGGSYRIVMTGTCGSGADGNHTVTGTYSEIIPNERLCFTWGALDSPSPKTFVTVEFRDVAEGTELTIRHERFENEEARAQHEYGWFGCLDGLEKYFAASGD